MLALEGGSIRYQSVGQGSEALLFLHGFNSQLSVWNQVWSHLSASERRVRIDIAGFGGSTWKTQSYGLDCQAERVIRFLDAMALSRVTLVGVSMGGALAAWIAAKFPKRVHGLLLLAPAGYPGALDCFGSLRALQDAGLPNRLATRIVSSQAFCRLFPQSAALQALTVTASYGQAWAEGLQRIQAKTWLLWSRDDDCVSFECATKVALAIPRCVFVELLGEVGHDIPANRPELVAGLASYLHQPSKRSSAHSNISKELR